MQMEQDSGPEAQLKFEANQARLEKNFETFGEEVPWHEVAALVRAGREVWSFGYDQNDPENFTTISEDDLQWFDNGEAYVAEWAPFRVSPLGEEHSMERIDPETGGWKDSDAAANMIAELEVMGYKVIAVEPGEPYCQSQFAEHWHKGETIDSAQGVECGACGGLFVFNEGGPDA